MGARTRHTGVHRIRRGTWKVRASVKSRGRQATRERTVRARTAAEAARVREKLRAELAHELTRGTAATGTETLGGYARRWLGRKKREVRRHTARHYAAVLADRVLPVLGHRPVRALTRADVLAWRDHVQRARDRHGRPYTQRTLRSWWAVFRVLLHDLQADTEGLPALTLRVRPPRSSRTDRLREGRALDADGLRALLEAVRSRWPDRYPEVYVLAWTGLRASELYALRWRDVDLAAGALVVRRSVVRGTISETKTGNVRAVALTAQMCALLRRIRPRPVDLAGLVFPADGGGPRDTRSLSRLLRHAGELAGLDVRCGCQVLRYTQNTLLRDAGAPDEQVRQRLGHAAREMGHVYYGAGLDAQRQVVEQLERDAPGGGPYGETQR